MEEKHPQLSQSINALYSGFDRFSAYPKDPVRAWIRKDGQFVQLEVWQYQADEVKFRCQHLGPEIISQWFKEKPEELNGEPPIAGIKILIVEGLDNSIIYDPDRAKEDLRKECEVLQQAVTEFQILPSALTFLSMSVNSPAYTKLLPSSNGYQTKSLGLPSQNVIFSQDPTNKFTYCIINDADSKHYTGLLEPQLKDLAGLTDIPTLLPYLTISIAVQEQGVLLKTAWKDIKAIEGRTGFKVWKSDFPINSAVFEEYSTLLSKASGLAGSFCSRRTDIQLLQLSLDNLLQDCTKLRAESALTTSLGETKLDHLISATEMLKIVSVAQLTCCQELIDRACIQKTALSHIMAREDQQVSLQIAKDSRILALRAQKDGLSMKTIAIMTMLFLPATLVATVFAMPIMKWDSDPVLDFNFVIFLIVAISFTLVVLVCWTYAMRWQAKKKPIPEMV